MLDELDRWQRWREEKGISCELMVETHWALTDPKDCLRLGKESGGRLTLLWDIGHTWNRRWVAPHEDWPMLKPLVRHIHIKDAVKDTTTPKGLKHVLPGSGEMPVVPLLEALDRDGFSGPVSLEWECFWNPEMPPLEEALASGRRHGWWA
jgi:sugar phosphate isomerase/epimerase